MCSTGTWPQAVHEVGVTTLPSGTFSTIVWITTLTIRACGGWITVGDHLHLQHIVCRHQDTELQALGLSTAATDYYTTHLPQHSSSHTIQGHSFSAACINNKASKFLNLYPVLSHYVCREGSHVLFIITLIGVPT